MIQEVSFVQQLTRLFHAFLINLSFLPLVLFIGIIAGMAVALIRFYKIPVLSQILRTIVDILRGVPFLMLIYGAYFILPEVGVEFSAYQAGILVLSMTSTAFLSETFLSGLNSISDGQYKAADSMGFRFHQKFLFIIFPQMMKIVLPALVGQIVMVVKDTSIVSLIGLGEIVRTSRQISLLTFDPFTSFGIVAVFFFILCFPLIILSKKLERR